MYFKAILIVILLNLTVCYGSIGDRSKQFQSCMFLCKRKNCSKMLFHTNQPYYLQLLGWDCTEECKYSCMWSTVEYFQSSGWDVPQFYGKWPFVRILGMQEPASVIFSLLNGMFNVIGFYKYYYGTSSATPLHYLVIIQLFVSLNAWFWSAIYHWRDFPLTEKLDYFCATSLVMYSLFFVLYRVTLQFFSMRRLWIQKSIFVTLLCIYLAHVSYLSFVVFDYGYNMIFNVLCGAVNCGLALIFYFYLRKTLSYSWKILAIALLTSTFLSFELLDFSPIYWVIDSHSIWHFLTIPLPLLFYSFARDDALYLLYHTEFLERKGV